MSGLPWARLDSNIASHDKILALIHDEAAPKVQRWQAVSSYMFAFAWSAGQGTDGRIPTHALTSVHGSKATAVLLTKHGLWDQALGGWQIHNFELRQQLSVVGEAKRAAQSAGARKGNCKRHHGEACGCWQREVG